MNPWKKIFTPKKFFLPGARAERLEEPAREVDAARQIPSRYAKTAALRGRGEEPRRGKRLGALCGDSVGIL